MTDRSSGVRLLASVNGRICAAHEAVVPAQDEGLLRGDGAFEVVRSYLGRPFKLAEHLDRLERSCRVLRLDCPRTRLQREIGGLLAACGRVSRDLRIVVTRGGTRVLLCERIAVGGTAVRLALVQDQPRALLKGAKCLSYAANMLARRIAVERGYEQALLVSPQGHVLEAQTAAFFWVTPDGTLCTPPLAQGILNSISRQVVVRSLPVEEQCCHVADALQASEAFLAGTAREVQPIAAVEERRFDPLPGPVARKAAELFWATITAETGVTPEEHFAALEAEEAAGIAAGGGSARRR